MNRVTLNSETPYSKLIVIKVTLNLRLACNGVVPSYFIDRVSRRDRYVVVFKRCGNQTIFDCTLVTCSGRSY